MRNLIVLSFFIFALLSCNISFATDYYLSSAGNDSHSGISMSSPWQTLEKLNGHAPRGITFTGLSLLREFQPGDPKTTVELWEAIINNLKQPQTGTPVSLQKLIFRLVNDPDAFLEEHFSTVWIDQENGKKYMELI